MFRKINKIMRGSGGSEKHFSKSKIVFLLILILMLILLFLGFYHHRRSDGSVIVELINDSHPFHENANEVPPITSYCSRPHNNSVGWVRRCKGGLPLSRQVYQRAPQYAWFGRHCLWHRPPCHALRQHGHHRRCSVFYTWGTLVNKYGGQSYTFDRIIVFIKCVALTPFISLV